MMRHEMSHVLILSGQLTVVRYSGKVWTLGRVGNHPHGALEWQELPPVPETEAAEAARRAAASPAMQQAEAEGIR